MSDQLFINDYVKSIEVQKEGFVIGKFRLKSRPSEIRYAVEFDNGGWVGVTVFKSDGLIKLPDPPDEPPRKAKAW